MLQYFAFYRFRVSLNDLNEHRVVLKKFNHEDGESAIRDTLYNFD